MSEVKVEVGEDSAVCRICLLSTDDAMVSIYDHDRVDTSLLLYQKIEKCAGIKVLTDPDLPHLLCKKCNTFLSIAYLFRTMCHNSDVYLRKFVCKATRSIVDDDEESIEYLLESGQDEDDKAHEAEILHLLDDEADVEGEGETEERVDHSAETAETLDTVDDGGGGGGGGTAVEDELDEATFDYEEVNDYTELWLNDEAANSLDMIHQDADDIIVVDHDESNATEPSYPAKTLDISSDGAAVIRLRSDKVLNSHSHSNSNSNNNGSKEKNKHICDICGNTYPRKYALDAHMRRHRDERPFECEICHQSFHLNFQLTRHIRKHTGSRPYSCQYCNRSFADRSTMVKHERIHRNERPYACDTCGKCFTYSSVLKVHQMTHTGEKPFICGICKKRFSRSHHLRAHLETLLHQNDPRAKVLLKQIKRDEEELHEEQ